MDHLNRRLLGAGALLLCGLLASHASALTFVVDSTDDEVDLFPGDTLCVTTSLHCTLRAPIQEANADPGLDEIDMQHLPPTRASKGPRPGVTL